MHNLAFLVSKALQTSWTPLAKTPWCKAEITKLLIYDSTSAIITI
jgi:hypothetical protein